VSGDPIAGRTIPMSDLIAALRLGLLDWSVRDAGEL
jgi:hypothetical protein